MRNKDTNWVPKIACNDESYSIGLDSLSDNFLNCNKTSVMTNDSS